MSALAPPLAALLVVAGYAVGGNAGIVLMLAGVAVAAIWLGLKVRAAWQEVDRS